MTTISDFKYGDVICLKQDIKKIRCEQSNLQRENTAFIFQCIYKSNGTSPNRTEILDDCTETGEILSFQREIILLV